jgi:hypothetical protein
MQVVMTVAFVMLLLIYLGNQDRFEIANNPVATSVTLFPLLGWLPCCIYACTCYYSRTLSLKIYQFCDNAYPPLSLYVLFPIPLNQRQYAHQQNYKQ